MNQNDAYNNETFQITCHVSLSDAQLFAAVINQGIDSHLEAFTESQFKTEGSRLVLDFALVELPILVRRLEASDDDAALLWSEDIRATPEFKEGLRLYNQRKVKSLMH